MSIHHFVLLPGLDGTGQLFTPFLKQLPPGLTASFVAYPRDIKLSYEQLKAQAFSALPATDPYVLIAESFSGPIAIEIAAEHPHNLKALVLCASFVSNPAPPLLQWIQFFNHPFWFRFRLPDSFVRYAAAMWDCEATVIHELIEQSKSVQPEVLADRFSQVMRVNVQAQLQRCLVPLLYLRAKRDLLVQARNWKEIVRLYPQASYAEIDASHFVLQHRPTESLQAILTFLAANFAR